MKNYNDFLVLLNKAFKADIIKGGLEHDEYIEYLNSLKPDSPGWMDEQYILLQYDEQELTYTCGLWGGLNPDDIKSTIIDIEDKIDKYFSFGDGFYLFRVLGWETESYAEDMVIDGGFYNVEVVDYMSLNDHADGKELNPPQPKDCEQQSHSQQGGCEGEYLIYDIGKYVDNTDVYRYHVINRNTGNLAFKTDQYDKAISKRDSLNNTTTEEAE